MLDPSLNLLVHGERLEIWDYQLCAIWKNLGHSEWSTPAGLKLSQENLQSRVKEEDSITDVENAVFDIGVMDSLCFLVFISMITSSKAIELCAPTQSVDDMPSIYKLGTSGTRWEVHAPVPRRPKTLMTSIMAPWPFYQWGMDILGPLPQAIDYFTKWIEAKPLARITRKDQRNGETPFSLTYGSEAVILAEIGMPTHQTMMIREDKNKDELRLNMDLLQERREATTIREAKYKTKMEQYYNQKVRLTSFKPDEYVF
ncbi:reverse transcriptase domain-containing protein [Tanacetum coccineum]|uniref:Reverse transcriptase domain-containing protein n=1 Tax=Tanacetum coccineum TaxID=301880 RepID=A0ABQ4ZR83_9ASTR